MNSIIASGIPFPDQLDRHPERAPLAILGMALEVTINSLATVHPEVWLEDEHGPLAHKVPSQAHRLLAHAVRLRRAMARYQSMLERQDALDRQPDPTADDMPF
jgi:hypothetical protein